MSAEIRWFWQEIDIPFTAAVERWFSDRHIKAGGGTPRRDVYAVDQTQVELGIKARGGKPGYEIKGLVSYLTPIPAGPLAGSIELWGKWSTSVADVPKSRITVEKQRWLRKLDFDRDHIVEIPLGDDEKPIDLGTRLPTLGCHIELTRTEVSDVTERWWTVGFEAFGPMVAVERILVRAVDLFRAGAPDFAAATQLSYPRWLNLIRRETGSVGAGGAL